MNAPTAYDIRHEKSILCFTGDDAATFLQGQTTCDVLSLNDSNSLFGAMCNPKGRAITLFHLIKRDNAFYMLLSHGLCADTMKRLKMFVFRSKVAIKDVSNQFVTLGLNETLPDSINKTLEPLACIQYTGDNDLALLITPINFKDNLSHHLNINSNVADWDSLLTSACIPDITQETSETFIPQMLNLDALKGISFQKGCYTGQEVIARMHYKGSVKRRLVSYQSSTAFIAGESLFTPSDSNSIGTVINSIPTISDTYIGLVVLKISLINDGIINLKDNNKITIRHPKYNLD